MTKKIVLSILVVATFIGGSALADNVQKQLTDLTVAVWTINERANIDRVENFLTFEDSVDPVRLKALADRLANEGLNLSALRNLSGKSSKALRTYLKSPQAVGVAARLSQEIDKAE